MANLEVKTIIDDITTTDLFYIRTNQDDQEVIWKKTTENRNGQEREIQNRFYIGTDHRPELDTHEKKHTFLINFLHVIEDNYKEDIDPEDSFETIITFNDDPEDPESKEPETYAVWKGHKKDRMTTKQTGEGSTPFPDSKKGRKS